MPAVPGRRTLIRSHEGGDVLTRLAWFTVRRRRLVLAFSALFIVAAAAIGGGAFGVLEDEGFEDPNAESTRAEQRAR